MHIAPFPMLGGIIIVITRCHAEISYTFAKLQWTDEANLMMSVKCDGDVESSIQSLMDCSLATLPNLSWTSF